MNVFCLLTGRGNNTLPDKNVLPVFGQPLLSYPARAASKVVNIENCYISSDDEKILKAGEDCGFGRIQRPAELAAPDSRHVDTILHGIGEIEKASGSEIDILIVMLANSATIKSEWLSQAISMLTTDPSISAVVPAYVEQDHHPFRAKKLNEKGALVPYFDFGDQDISSNRQDLPANYFLCHNFWALNVKQSIARQDGFKPWAFLGKNVHPIIVENSFDVHNREDILRTERWLRENNIV
ncbi:cytidylyltransferase domain-containing protein [Pseudomaricurvus sp. HS19]|uniref:acylneuraminate cytidylyltransferase family protein n=1 Tax=Pseudomaricurvus sp. HS19 TaxID=2692626 RepID=UPI0013721F77|nr:NTP transferase domain-containing protein [Pseudomaricurvus sp. HS19]MYM62865.1 NTP transferase domain-containing protein [Pseudomaricurvus sp. HS19]